MNSFQLEQEIERHFAAGSVTVGVAAAMEAFLALRNALETGAVRAASPDPDSPTGWRVNAWVKKGILLGFRLGTMQDHPASGFSFVDKHTYPVRHFTAETGVRIVPGDPRFAPGLTSRGAWFACRPCTSTWGHGWMKAPWSTRTRWSAPAPRSASAST